MSDRLIGLLAALAAIAGLVAWALYERAGRLSCEVARVEITAAYTVLADKVKQQNAAMSELAAKGRAARQAGRSASIGAEAMAKEAEPEIASLKIDAAAPTPAGKTCVDAWAMIQKGAP